MKKMKCLHEMSVEQKKMKVQMMTLNLLSNWDNCDQTPWRNAHDNV